MIEINKEALKAVQAAAYEAEEFGRSTTLEEDIRAYLAHPDVDLVLRSEIRKGWQELMAERDKARREAARQTLLQEMRATECEALGKQIAALREALEEAKGTIKAWHNMPISGKKIHPRIWETYAKHSPEMKHLRAVLTDTAKAAEGYQKVPRGWMVVQRPDGTEMLTIDEDVDEAAPNPEAGEGTG